MDPLAAPLSCPCVEGYAQRKYEKLAEYLEPLLGRPVRLTFSESLSVALKGKAEGRADLIIGKDSVVRADAKSVNLKVTALASLTGKDGATSQTGLFVVPAADPAKKVADLAGYRIFFGRRNATRSTLPPSTCCDRKASPYPTRSKPAPPVATGPASRWNWEPECVRPR